MEPEKIDSQSGNHRETSKQGGSSQKLIEFREDEIKKIGIIQHLKRVGERVEEVYKNDDLNYEDKENLYQQYLHILYKDIEMIQEQKKAYDEELPDNVVSITKPIDDNMVKVMNECLAVINNYIQFIDSEDSEDIKLISDSFKLLEETSYLLDETEDMLKVILESVESKGGVIGEA
ncbi:MAG: hypothetical protein BWY64_01612 [bacterium ADurb.Bin363]|nr:MAG: hypothetical protein BWY64_01612 [bacterium ADurb.Bin363]